jgi:hypothetical protein
LQPRDIGAERRRGRARHVGAKATDWRRETGGFQDPPGVRKAARSDSGARNRRDPPRRPSSGKDSAYKPKAKGSRAGRESEGLIVPWRAGESRTEGRGPALVALGLGVSARA